MTTGFYPNHTTLSLTRPAPTVEIVTITKEIAERWLLFANERNRTLRPRHVAKLRSSMEEGKFLLGTDAIGFDWNDRQINGHHRLLAISESGVPVECIVVRGLDPDVVPNLDSGKRRSLSDNIAMLVNPADAKDMATMAHLLYLWQSGDNVALVGLRPVDATEIVATVLEHDQELRDSLEVVKALKPKSNSLAAYSFAYYLISQAEIGAGNSLDRVTEFFHSFIKCVGLVEGSPAHLLDGYFRGDGSRGRKAPVNAAYIIKAWNAEACGQPLKNLSFRYRAPKAGALRNPGRESFPVAQASVTRVQES